ncbi:MAG: glycosyltransferase [Patescibacteria group bacterium]
MKKRIKVLQITHGLGAGGAERLVYELAMRLPKHGFDVKTVAVLEGGPLEKDFTKKGLKLVKMKKRGLLGLGTIADLVCLMKEERPDIVHTHLFLADFWGRIAACRAGVPIVITTEHNVNVEYRVKHHFVNRLLSPLTGAFIAVSGEVKKYLMKKEGVPERKISVILNGIDLKRVKDRGARLFHEPPQIISVGRLFEQKDHETLLRALAKVEKPWSLRIVGTGPLEKFLRDLVEELKIDSKVEWLGFRDDVPKLLFESDVFCFPSRWEGLGLAAIEAAAAGLPIIATDLPALKEVFNKGEVRFVKSGEVDRWAKAISEVLDNPSFALRTAAKTQERIKKQFSIDRMVGEYVELYKRLLSS